MASWYVCVLRHPACTHTHARTHAHARTHTLTVVPAPPLQPIKYTDNSLVMNDLRAGSMFQNKWALESNIFAYSERTQHGTYFKKSDYYSVTGECALDPTNCRHRVCGFADASTRQFKLTKFMEHSS